VAAVGAIGYRLGSTPPDSPQRLAVPSSHSDQQRLAADESVPIRALPSSPSVSPAVAIVRAPYEQPSPGAASSLPRSGRITVGAMPPRQSGQTARLTVSVANAGPDAAVVIGGLPPGSALSTGRQVGPNAWRLSIEDLATAAVTPPRGFTGSFDLTLELHRADGTVADRTSLHLDWSGNAASAVNSAAKPPPRRLDAGEIAAMVKSGTEHMANGSIGAARMMFQPAAEAGDPAAAFALAETYDPLVLKKLNAKGGITANVGLAQTWYQKARDLGSAAAPERIERLTQLPE
jgi:hypothetical protein